jgi:hypothetical protein
MPLQLLRLVCLGLLNDLTPNPKGDHNG